MEEPASNTNLAETAQRVGPPPRVEGADGITHVVWFRLADQVRAVDVERLTGPERARLAGLRRASDAAAFASGHRHRRELLAQLLRLEPEAVEVCYGPCASCGSSSHGAPAVVSTDAPVPFSWARSGHHAVLAVAGGDAVGVDVEGRVPGDLTALAERFMAAPERAELRAARTPSRQRAIVLRSWVRKEALTKALGTGIVTDLRAFDARPTTAGPLSLDGPGAAGWTVDDLAPPASGLAAALARRFPGPLRVLRVDAR